MLRRFWLPVGLCFLSVACGKSSPTPTSPTSLAGIVGEAAADGSTLKVTAPTPVSPVNGQQPTDLILVVNNAAAKFTTPVALTYRFEIHDAAGTLINAGTTGAGSGTTSFAPEAELEEGKQYKWRARAEYQGAFGPWSSDATFTGALTTGYIRGNELYDPLINGKTVGTIFGPAQFVPGVGLKLLSESTYVQYTLPQTLTEGEYSVLATNMGVVSSTEDPKLRIFTMREGEDAINDNIYRMSVDKRGNGAIAWRFISGNNSKGNYVETVGSERQIYPFHEDLTYFVKATWRGGLFNVTFVEGGVNGTIIYNFGKPYDGIYQPSPHNVYIGSPFKGGDRGDPSSLTDMIIRQIWVSPNPRPARANK